jgi:hypothetical protein
MWAIANITGGREPFVEGVIHTGALRTSAWQLLFVVGVVLGGRWAAGSRVVSTPKRVVLFALAALALVCAASRHGWLPGSQPWAAELANKATLGPLRVVNAAVLFALITLAVRARSEWFTWAPLTFLGQHSLAAFTTHVVVAELVLGLPQYFETSASGRAMGNMLLLASMFAAAGTVAAVKSGAFARFTGVRQLARGVRA